MSELTPNEKAATYIGWPDYAQLENLDDGWQPCKAPDMSEPANYMKALESIPLGSCRYEDPSFEFSYENDQHLWEFRIFENGEVTRLRMQTKSRTLGGAIVAALAALYDAEHGNRSDNEFP